MTEVAQRQAGPLAEKMQYAKALASASLLPSVYREKPGNVLLAMELGDALGLATITAINQVNVIDGKPSSSAALISALVRRAGHRLRVTGDDTHAVAEIIRADDPKFPFRAEWTLERAKRAGLLGKGAWITYPAAMLKARAITECARDACQEALFGMQYTSEELGADVDEDGTPVTQEIVEGAADPIRPPRPVDELADEAHDAADKDTLAAIWREATAQRQLEVDVADRTTGEFVPLGTWLQRCAARLAQDQDAEQVDAEQVDEATSDADQS
jgi:hypothetical protein